MIKYDEKYYDKIIKTHEDYEYIKQMPKLEDGEVTRRWIDAYNINPFKEGIKKKEKVIFTMGIGINSPPHLGTIMQILNAIYLQKNGYKVQIVLGDLDVYAARDTNFKIIKRHVNKYKRFITKLGFDTTKGIIRTQSERPDINQTAYLISNYVNDSDFYETEEDINYLYKKEKKYKGMTFGVKQSIVLMYADFIHLGLKEKYKHVVVLSGIDEHGHTMIANRIVNRMNLNMSISGLHTRIIQGLNNYPKMSKTFLLSCITVETKKRDLKCIFNSDDETLNKLILKIIENVSFYSLKKVNIIKKHYEEDNEKWLKDKKKYYLDLINIIEKWR